MASTPSSTATTTIADVGQQQGNAPSGNAPLAPREPIAIVGSSCRFPGDSSSPSKLWQLLQQPRDVQAKIPSTRFNPDGFYHPDNAHHGSSNVRHAYLLTSQDHRHFDAQFFAVKPAEANAMDPQQRLLLETVYEGIEAAGLRLEDLQGSQTGVYVGLMCADYADMLVKDTDSFPTYLSTGTARSIMANRVSYFFDWHGPCMTIDTACSSSLVALDQAVQLLRSGNSRVAVAAGSNLCLGPEPFIAESKLKMLSPSGRSRMWSANADGYARGDGVAAVVLKTLSAAIQDGDSIECVIRETGVNQDGRTHGITMPSATAQLALIRETYRRAGLDLSNPDHLPQYFEAHGTGTPAGDPIEAEAISSAFGATLAADATQRTLWVGSIKTVIGHTEGTAGLASLIKASMALRHGVVPPNMHFDRLNPKIEPFYAHLQIPTAATPWPAPSSGPRRASVNSFGFGGTNAHAILEQFVPPANSSPPPAPRANLLPFVFSAASEASLMSSLSDYLALLDQSPDGSVNMTDLAYTLMARRSKFPFKAVFSSKGREPLLSKLKMAVHEKDLSKVVHETPKHASKQLLGIFTGQGAQWPRMGRDLLLHLPMAQAIIHKLEQCLASLPPADRPLWSLRGQLLADERTSLVRQARVSQPICTAVQIMLVDILKAANISFNAVIGHSSGEIAACYAAGLITAENAMCIAYYRGLHSHLAQGASGQQGAMMAVGTSIEDAFDLCNDVAGLSVAAINSNTSITLSGDLEAVQQAKAILDDEKKFARMLAVDKAYHSHHMLPCSEAYLSSLASLDIKLHETDGSCKWYSSVRDMEMDSSKTELKGQYWVDNMTKPVLYSQALECAIAGIANPALAIEVGPHPALRGPSLQVVQDLIEQPLQHCGTLKRGSSDLEALGETLAAVWEHVGIEATQLAELTLATTAGYKPSVVKDLPAYSWNHDRVYWHESRTSRAMRTRSSNCNELLGRRQPEDPENQFRWRNLLSVKEIPYLAGHLIQGQMIFPAAGYLSAAVEAAKQMAPRDNIELVELENVKIGQAIVFEDVNSTVETLVTVTGLDHQDGTLTADFSFYSAGPGATSTMVLNTRGKLVIKFGADNALALPERQYDGLEMIDVPQDRFYQILSGLGYGYERSFRALHKLQRRLGVVSGALNNPLPEDDSKLLVHPATLDAAIQSIMLAESWPGDGRLWSLHVPTEIARVAFNPAILTEAISSEQCLEFDASVQRNLRAGILGDVAIFNNRQSCAIIMEGIRAIPLEPPSAANDRTIFSSMHWGLAAPNAGLVAFDGRATAADYELALILERVAHFYLRRLNLTFRADALERSTGPYSGLLNYAAHITKSVSTGTHKYAQSYWQEDTEAIIAHESAKYPTNIDLRVMHIIGKNMASVIRDQSTILEFLRVDNLLDDYYVQAMGISYYANYLARTLGQLTHRYPHLDILEIGAGTGGATKPIMKTLDRKYRSYTYTDVSSGFFENAQQIFNNEANMIYRTLNVERDTADQGFEDASYDVVVASFVLHATQHLETTLLHARRLLRPGGYLLLLEVTNLDQARLGFIFGSLPGWWLGADDGRVLSPCVTVPEWDALLRKTGFSGADTATPDPDPLPFPASVIVSQAVDPTFDFLRDPLYSPYDSLVAGPGIQDLVVVGGSTPRIERIVSHLAAILRPHCASFEHVKSIEDLAGRAIASNTTFLNLADLDRAIFQNLSDASFEGIKAMYNHAGAILWVTSECWDNNPHHSQSLGFGRSMQVELPHVRSQFLDLDRIGRSTAIEIAEAFMRFAVCCTAEVSALAENMLWTVETEIAVRDEQQRLPRVLPNQQQNDRYNSAKRRIVRSLPVSDSSPVHLTLHDQGALEVREHFVSPLAKVSYRKIKAITSSTCAVGKQFLVYGTDQATGEKLLCFSEANASHIALSPASTTVCSAASDAANLVGHANAMLVVRVLAEMLPLTGVIVVLHPSAAVSLALGNIMDERKQRLVAITTATNAAAAEGANGVVTVHPASTARELARHIPKDSSCIVDFGADPKLTQRLREALPASSSASTLSAQELIKHVSLSHHEDLLQDLVQYSQNAATLSEWSVIKPDEVHGAVVDASSLGNIDAGALDVLFDWTTYSSALVEIEPVARKPLIRSDRTYWLVGLTGSLGISLARWIIDNGGTSVVLTSRNPKVDAAVVDELQTSGARVSVLAGDVTDAQSLRNVYSRICEDLPPVAGIAQGAMVLRDTMITDMVADTMHAVMRPKVQGTKNLDDLFPTDTLDFFICFSSATCVTGNLGQSNYSVANMYMTGLTAQRRRRGLAGSAIDIGAILGVGYVTRETSQALQENLLKSGHVWMSEEDFHTLFAEAILAGRPDALENSEISSGLATIDAGSDSKPLWALLPKFQHLVADTSGSDATIGSASAAVSLKIQLLEAQSTREITEALSGALFLKLKSVLQLDDSATAENTMQLAAADLGIDSLNAVELRSWFLKECKVDMPVLRILGGSSAADLIGIAVESIPESLAPARSSTFKPDPTAKKTSPAAAPKKVKTNPVISKATTAAKKALPPTTVGQTAGASNPTSLLKELALRSDRDRSFSAPVNAAADAPVVASNARSASSSSSSRDSSIDAGSTSTEKTAPSAGNASVRTSKDRASDGPLRKDTTAHNPVVRSGPMSLGQSRFWFLQNLLGDKSTFNIACHLRIVGELDVASLKRAVREIGNLHEALRTKFYDDENGVSRQAVLKSGTLELELGSYRSPADIQSQFDGLQSYNYGIGNGQVMRMVLLLPAHKTTKEHHFLIGYHHINMDGISLEIILQQLEKAYRREPFTSKAIQYPDFSRRQLRQMADNAWSADVDYWRTELRGMPDEFPLMSFASVNSRQVLTDYRHREATFRIPQSLAKDIQTICTKNKVTPYHVYLTVYYTLLARLAKTGDVCIGVASGNRHESDTLESVGFYLNLLPLRLGFNPQDRFNEALRSVRGKSYAAMAHSQLPFNVLLDELKTARSANRNPLFQVFLDYRQSIEESRPFGDAQMIGSQYQSSRTAYDVVLDVVDNKSGEALLIMAVQEHLYNDESLDMMLNSFVYLLRQFAEDGDKRLSSPGLYDTVNVEKALRLGRGRTSQSLWPGDLCHRIEDMVAQHGDKLALLAANEVSLTYNEMWKRVAQISNELVQRGAHPGDCVAVYMDSGVDWICALLAILCSGAIYVPLDARVPLERLSAIIADCKPRLIVGDSTTVLQASSLGVTPERMVDVTKCQATETTFAINATSDSAAAIMYTSGSTGTPKGIILKHAGLVNNIEGSTGVFRIDHQDVVMQQIALSFDFSLWQIFISLANGAALYMVSNQARGDPTELSEIISTAGITVTGATPSEYMAWLRYGQQPKLKASRWRMAVSGGEPLTEQLKAALRALDKPGLKLFNGFGPTEVTISSNKTEIPYVADNEDIASSALVPVGFTVPNYAVYILDDDLDAVPVGIRGQVAIGGAGVAAGYLNDAERTRARFMSDPFATPEYKARGWNTLHLTGDRGYLRPDGALVLEGRMSGDTQIKLRGLRIDLRDIESTIIRSAGGTVLDCVVTLKQDFLIAHLVFARGALATEQSDAIQRLSQQLPLPKYMVPSMFIALHALPTTAHGKLDRKAIAALPLPQQSSRKLDDMTNSLSTAEREIHSLWAKVVPQDIWAQQNVTSTTDFFQAGGNSLLLVKLRKLLQTECSVEISVADLFANSTLQSMASSLVSKRDSSGTLSGDSNEPVTVVTSFGETPFNEVQALGVQPADDVKAVNIKVPSDLPKAATMATAEHTPLIDWDEETALPEVSKSRASADSNAANTERAAKPETRPKIVILTGATGFLGRELLLELIADKTISKIHCVAVRNTSHASLLAADKTKVIIHSGDLAAPRLGLSEAIADAMFDEADAVIHNGADVSFMKQYQSLRATNVGSTREIVRLASSRHNTAPLAIHYISTASVGNLSGQLEFPEISAASLQPPVDGSYGYISSKWASERLLERASSALGLSVVIHRPSSVTGANSPDLDLMHNLIKYSRAIKAVPTSPKWHGYLDFVSVETTAYGIVSNMLHHSTPHPPQPSSRISYLHHSGDIEVPVRDMKAHLEQQEPGTWYRAMPLAKWAAKAQDAGLSELLAAFLVKTSEDEGEVVFPRLVKGAVGVDGSSSSMWNGLWSRWR